MMTIITIMTIIISMIKKMIMMLIIIISMIIVGDRSFWSRWLQHNSFCIDRVCRTVAA